MDGAARRPHPHPRHRPRRRREFLSSFVAQSDFVADDFVVSKLFSRGWCHDSLSLDWADMPLVDRLCDGGGFAGGDLSAQGDFVADDFVVSKLFSRGWCHDSLSLDWADMPLVDRLCVGGGFAGGDLINPNQTGEMRADAIGSSG